MVRLEPEFLDKVWHYWVTDKVHEEIRSIYLRRTYQYVSRKDTRSQRFETWLFDQGASVRQHNHVRYLEFADEELALIFVLKHS